MPRDFKYGEVTTEFGDIPDDEPVVVFRGRDVVLPRLMEIYAELCMEEGSPDHHVGVAKTVEKKIRNWQDANLERVRIPQSNAYVQRTGGHDIEKGGEG